ncbi:hypothetical protein ACJIZ3_010501 [Penstemon smallii]|uniref:Exostosin GT47 domain-containing protein n=1 Tax=Penstemon smallii TaxID=265156 RepID=A0ABD3TH53_9LAMI
MAMLLRTVFGKVKLMQRVPHRSNRNACFMLSPPFAVLLISTFLILSLRPELSLFKSSVSAHDKWPNMTYKVSPVQQRNPKEDYGSHTVPFSSSSQLNSTTPQLASPPPSHIIKTMATSPYHNWELFYADYQEMLQKLKIFVYPMNNESSPFSGVFLPHPNPLNPKIGNYFSEHAFKLALLQSSLVTQRPEEAHFFFMPFSINAMRNYPLFHSESSIPNFVAHYILKISSEFQFWNVSAGADHFFICCHSVGREATSKHFALHNNAIQVTCSSSYFNRLYSAHKDIALPQVWPRHQDQVLNPPSARNKLVFFAGRVQNSPMRKEILRLWGNDTSFSMFSGHSSFPYEEGFKRSKYCLHIKGYDVNTARISDAIHYGCIPVVISNYYDLPFANILDWSKFSIVVHQSDIALLKHILISVTEQMYQSLYQNLYTVRKHFSWHPEMPVSYDSFYMTVYQLWLRRGLHRLVA